MQLQGYILDVPLVVVENKKNENDYKAITNWIEINNDWFKPIDNIFFTDSSEQEFNTFIINFWKLYLYKDYYFYIKINEKSQL